MIYLDSGIIIKLYVKEPDSQAWRDRLRTQVQMVTSNLSLAEMRSALRQKVQLRLLRPRIARDVWLDFQRLVSEGTLVTLPVGQDVVVKCLSHFDLLPRKSGLRTLDALHLATASLVNGCFMATTDRQMIAAAKLLSVPLF
jgi:predicted nucleic acid-binding protein